MRKLAGEVTHTQAAEMNTRFLLMNEPSLREEHLEGNNVFRD